MTGYNATLKDNSEIYIPSWPIDISIENLTLAGKYLGVNHVMAITEINISAVILAIMESTEPKQTAKLIKHFVCQVRIDEKKITPEGIDTMFEGNLGKVAELFTHVMHAQYSDFFEYGLVAAVSPKA